MPTTPSKYKEKRIRILYALGMPIEQIAKKEGVSQTIVESCILNKEQKSDSQKEFTAPKAKEKYNVSIDEIVTQEELIERFSGELKMPFCPECKSLIHTYRGLNSDTKPYFYCPKCNRFYLLRR